MIVSNIKLIEWYKEHIKKKEYPIEDIVLKLGEKLKENNYEGIDVNKNYSKRNLSTVYAFCSNGWINLYKISNKKTYLAEAENCVQKILEMQTDEGVWLFPYAFRKNPPNFVYACENFMTLNALLKYYIEVEESLQIKNSIFKALKAITNKVGYTKEGCFFYSPTDKIKVPNISSMAASIFSRAGFLFKKKEFIKKAILFSNYCIKNQNADGGYRYFEENEMVYLPYHALEIWELIDANHILKSQELEQSIERALNYLKKYLSAYGYISKSNELRRRISKILFKTPLWSAKAFLKYNDIHKCNKHFKAAVTLFKIPKSFQFFYYLNEIKFNGKPIFYFPDFDSIFLRYNASCFDIGSEIFRYKYFNKGG